MRAVSGRPGSGAIKTGRDGVDIVIRVPPGTINVMISYVLIETQSVRQTQVQVM